MDLSGNECPPTMVSVTKYFRIQNIYIGLKCTSQFGVRSAGRSKFGKRLSLIFGYPY